MTQRFEEPRHQYFRRTVAAYARNMAVRQTTRRDNNSILLASHSFDQNFGKVHDLQTIKRPNLLYLFVIQLVKCPNL